MNEAEEIFLGGIESCAYNSRLELKLLSSYVDLNLEENTELKNILLKSINRIDDLMINIKSTIDQIKKEEFI